MFLPSARRILVPRKVAKVLHPVNIPSPVTLLTPSIRKPRRRSAR